MRRNVGKRYLATLPPPLHRAMRQEAESRRIADGGHLNINRVLVLALLQVFAEDLTPAERAEVSAFIASRL